MQWRYNPVFTGRSSTFYDGFGSSIRSGMERVENRRRDLIQFLFKKRQNCPSSHFLLVEQSWLSFLKMEMRTRLLWRRPEISTRVEVRSCRIFINFTVSLFSSASVNQHSIGGQNREYPFPIRLAMERWSRVTAPPSYS